MNKCKLLKNWAWLVILLVGCCSLGKSQIVHAAGGTFSVEPEQLTNQIGSVKGGWYLHVQPNQTYQLKFKILNLTNQSNVITVKPIPAQTNSDLQLMIDNPYAKPGPKAQFDLRKLVTPLSVEVPAKKEVEAAVTLKMPRQRLIGLIMGGLLFQSQTDLQQQEQQAVKNKQGSATVSTANISYGLNLRQDDAILLPHFQVGTPILISQANRVMMQTPIKNTAPYPFLKGRLKVKISKKNYSRANCTMALKNVNFAPNSQTKLVLPWRKGRLMPGTYNVTYILDHHKQHYVFHRHIVLSPQQSKKLNYFLPRAQRKYRNVIIILVLFLVILMGLISWWVYAYGHNLSKKNQR